MIHPTTKSQSAHDSFYELSEQLPKCSPVECTESKAGSAVWAGCSLVPRPPREQIPVLLVGGPGNEARLGGPWPTQIL